MQKFSTNMHHILPLTSLDLEELSSFLASFPNTPEKENQLFWLNRFKLWWDNNPAFTAHSKRGWILRGKNKIVGFYGVIPTKFQLLGKEIVVFNGTTWRVLPGYRTKSLKLLFELINYSKDSILFSTTLKNEGIEICKRLEYKLIPMGNNKQKYKKVSFIVLNFKKPLNNKLGDNFFSNLIIKLFIPFLFVFQSLSIRNLKKAGTTNVRELMEADYSFNQLWQKTKNLYLNTNVRTADIINWYCFENKDYEKKLLGYYRNDQLLGYMICWGRGTKKLKILECLDLWIDPAENHVIESLILYAKEYAQKNLFHLVIFPHFTDTLEKYYKKIGLFTKSVGLRREYFKVNELINKEINDANSYFVAAQGNYGL